MLKKYLNKLVRVEFSLNLSRFSEGIVTGINDKFLELDNEEAIRIEEIIRIEIITEDQRTDKLFEEIRELAKKTKFELMKDKPEHFPVCDNCDKLGTIIKDLRKEVSDLKERIEKLEFDKRDIAEYANDLQEIINSGS